jgi:hypothetical protein
MPDGWITDPKVLLREVGAFVQLKERRRFERRPMHVAASIEVRGERFEGQIVDLSPGGARIRFDAPLAAGEEMNIVLQELTQLGAQVVWRRDHEAGVRFLLAPEDVAPRLEAVLEEDARARAAAAKPPPPPPVAAPVRKKSSVAGGAVVVLAAAGFLGMAGLIGGGLMLAAPAPEPGAVLAVTGGASDQHGCPALLGKVASSTNQIGFALNVASAAEAKCLNLQTPGFAASTAHARAVQAAKASVQ